MFVTNCVLKENCTLSLHCTKSQIFLLCLAIFFFFFFFFFFIFFFFFVKLCRQLDLAATTKFATDSVQTEFIFVFAN